MASPPVARPAAAISASVAPQLPAVAASALPPTPSPGAQPSASLPAPLAAAQWPLLLRHPRLGRALPRASLGRWPTPVDAAAPLAAHLGLRSLHIKRDDVSASPYGGGKARKLELILGAAQRAGRSGVITFGGVGSHHALATAIYARSLGMRAVLVLLPQRPTAEVRRSLLALYANGAELHLTDSLASAERMAQRLAAADDGLVEIAPGGSSPLGNVGFIAAAFELAAQIEAGALPQPSDIYIALGTMGSAVGLAIGLEAAGVPSRVVAVRASNRSTSTRAKLEALYVDTVAFVRDLDPSFPAVTLDPAELVIEGRQLGRGYALPTPQGAAALALFAQHTGGALDHTYTAKAFAAVVASGAGDRAVLFWNTHNSYPLDVSSVDYRSLPPRFHGYFTRE